MQRFLLLVMMTFNVEANSLSIEFKDAFGFDWYDPENSICQEITTPLAETFTKCKRVNEKTSFLGLGDYYVCSVEKGEFLIYSTKRRCEDEFETMQANAP